MKKVLLATTALALSAGVAYAEVSVSGNARMGLQYNSAAANETTIEKRMTIDMVGATETASGITLGAKLRIRSNEGVAQSGAGARVYMRASGVELAMGNIDGAIESMPGVYSPSAGLTGLGWGGLVTNTVAKGFWGWDAYSSSGNGAEGVEVIYSAGSFTGHLSYSDADLGSAATRTAVYGAYTMGDWTVAVGYQDSDDNTEDKTVVTVGGTVGGFGVGVGYADNDGETKLALNGSATFGAATVSGYYADEESASDNPMGLGVSYDIGGASVVGGVARTAAGDNRADLGVSFSF